MPLLIFCLIMLACLILNISVIYALAAGLVLFLLYGKSKGFSWAELAGMAFDGIKTVRNILITLFLIGILTAFWRAGGTIPVIVSFASELIHPSIFLLMVFLLNSVVSVLTGTSFGTSATMGVICASIGMALGVDMRITGGVILAGAFFGDRCSPVSTSAILVAELTETNIYANIKRMVRSSLIPFLITCGIYILLGLSVSGSADLPDLKGMFSRVLTLHWTAVIPAAVIIMMSLLHCDVKLTMSASIVSAVLVCIFPQHMPVGEIFKTALLGYHSADEQVGAMLNGGGLVSMIRVTCIICLSSSYSGIFRRTGLLKGIKGRLKTISEKTTSFTAVLLTSVISALIACNQTLTVMLTDQLCRDLKKDPVRDKDIFSDVSPEEKAKEDALVFANMLEDSAIVIAPLVPWSIAGAVPLAAIGAPLSAILFACYLYLIPLWRLAVSFWKKYRRS